ncbi:MAG TPA: 50S ribosomal protein L9 [Rhodospirillaceae bacterium]|nr:50S ribosomal protein L9 [Rhodospirillaceae bacterium]MAX62031.1 50S ribosomal protein L9 [Rhodospirillaceae bacterium]MBB58001.1 50S ribosomal protein L9 [Rhodospirillaceae bacterium]HAE02310.1 50S ribosomal protein L9 [Rhodospirillaceae bacterium]HAJ18510.1 50S ribosomal protein L9 [Rhodospirillaceae bacterium]|tara:strand:- start:9950 stop:10606 length:657 start_codon:yes stop_codon:yes gene_type:complete
MQIILLERVEKLGQMGDEVAVKPGYARNFLLPQGKAVRATKSNRERFESQRIELEARNLERKSEAERVANDLNGLSVVLIRAASDTGQLYGSVTARDIADSIIAAGTQIGRGQVMMERPVKTIGIFDFRIKLHPEVIVTVQVNVAQSQEEAEAQAERKARGEDVVVTEAERANIDMAEEAERQAAQVAAAAAELVDEETAERILDAAHQDDDEGEEDK